MPVPVNPLVLYHANCADGFCAAWVAHRKYPGAEFVPVNYGQAPPDVTGRYVFILDFCFPAEVLHAMTITAQQVVQLDHHKTTAAILKQLATLKLPEGVRPTRFVSRFDVTKSGGRLAWEQFFPHEKSSWLVDYTEDRDLWRWKLADSKAISAFIASYPFEFARWDLWSSTTDLLPYIAGGLAVLQYQSRVVDSAVANAVEIDLDGHKVLCVNATTLISETCEVLAKGRPFGASFFIRNDGKKVWSLRSREGGVDVSEIAKRHGGGGHPQAAGFEEPGL